MMRSRLYDSSIFHLRERPRRHQFLYRYFHFCIDLDEMESGEIRSWLFGTSFWSVFRFVPQDFFLGTPQTIGELREGVRTYALSKGITNIERIEVLGHLRMFGYSYNPATFYFCYSRSGELICSMIEITNTFRERKIYFVSNPSHEQARTASEQDKLFYVSPFMRLDSQFRFVLNEPTQKLLIEIDSYEDNIRTIHSQLRGTSKTLCDSSLVLFLVKYSWVPMFVMLRIHWQAAQLFLKRVPFLRKREQSQMQKGGFS